MRHMSSKLSQARDLVLLVEGKHDAEIVCALLRRAQFPMDRIKAIPVGGKANIRQLLANLTPESNRYAALIDADAVTVPDAEAHARQELGDPPVPVFCAVPTLEAWLVADSETVGRVLNQEDEEGRLEHALAVESLQEWSGIVRRLRDRRTALHIIEQMDIEVASVRSPSMRTFMKGIGDILEINTSFLDQAYARSLGRDTIANLLAEVARGDVVVYRTAEGDAVTAEAMINQINGGTDLGRQYASDLLRISRDFLARKAQREVQR